MRKEASKNKKVCQDAVMGTAVLGERGQLVIPKEIRDRYELKTGDKFFVLGHGHGPIAFLPLNQMQDFIQNISFKIQEAVQDSKT